MAEILKGAPVAGKITEQLASRAEALKTKGIDPTLAIVRVGENESDLAYERGAMKRCEKTGINVRHIVLPADSTTETLIETIEQINADSSVHGCLMFRPLPRHIDEFAVCEALDAAKDVDCITRSSLATVFCGKGSGYAPCTAQSCMEILNYYGVELTGKRVAVIGRSMVIGKPVSMLLQAANATVAMCHTKTTGMAEICREADIIVAAAGHINTVTADFIRSNQIIIDVGINVDEEGRLCGDVSFDAVSPLVSAITPVPGGVGSVTTAVLCKHVIEAAEKTIV